MGRYPIRPSSSKGFMKNLFAFTAPGTTYPEFISVNTEDGSNVVEITVREKAKLDGACGQTATISISRHQALELASALLRYEIDRLE
jgi:hypothetical protein